MHLTLNTNHLMLFSNSVAVEAVEIAGVEDDDLLA